MSTIRVILCDDSPLMRRLLAKMLSVDPAIQVAGEADNGEQCLARIEEHTPDVVLLDLAMPTMDGVECLKQIRAKGLDPAVIVVSTRAQKDAPATIEALAAGAVDFITKAQGMMQMESIQSEVLAKVKAAAEARRKRIAVDAPRAAPPPPAAAPVAPAAKLLTVLGGSAGCMQVLPAILSALPPKPSSTLVLVLKLPPFLLKQIPAQFGKTCPAPIEVAAHGQPLAGGRVYIAPGGDVNLLFARDADGKRVLCQLDRPAGRMDEGTPSIDETMRSAVQLFRGSTRGVLISGTGKDGIEGLRAVLAAGGETVVQERASAIAPQLVLAALEAGLAQRSLSAADIAGLFIK